MITKERVKNWILSLDVDIFTSTDGFSISEFEITAPGETSYQITITRHTWFKIISGGDFNFGIRGPKNREKSVLIFEIFEKGE